jgi:hypothetical protein
MKEPKFRPLAVGQWEPQKKGEQFHGKVQGRKLVDTKNGWKPIVEIANLETGELIEVFATNMRLRGLNRVPIGGEVKLTYEGEEMIKVGRSKKLIPIIHAAVAANVKLVDDWSLAKLAEFDKGKKTVRNRKKRK